MGSSESHRLEAGLYRWIQPETGLQRFEVLAPGSPEGGGPWGALTWNSAWGTLATASFPAGDWTFKRTGFFSPRITVRRLGQEPDIAVYQPRWTGGGTLEFADGRVFPWVARNFWGTRWAWLGPGEVELVTFGPGDSERWRDLFKIQGESEVCPPAGGLDQAPLLLLMGWYLRVMQHRDAAAAGAVGASG